MFPRFNYFIFKLEFFPGAWVIVGYGFLVSIQILRVTRLFAEPDTQSAVCVSGLQTVWTNHTRLQTKTYWFAKSQFAYRFAKNRTECFTHAYGWFNHPAKCGSKMRDVLKNLCQYTSQVCDGLVRPRFNSFIFRREISPGWFVGRQRMLRVSLSFSKRRRSATSTWLGSTAYRLDWVRSSCKACALSGL